MHACGPKARRVPPPRLQVRQPADGGERPDPRDRDLHPHAAAEDGGRRPAPQARGADRGPPPAAPGGQEPGLPEVLPPRPVPVHALRPAQHALHRAQRAGPSSAEPRQPVQLEVPRPGQPPQRLQHRCLQARQPGLQVRLPIHRRPRLPRPGRVGADAVLLSEPRRGGVRHEPLLLHAPARVPGQQDLHPDDLQRAEAPHPGRHRPPLQPPGPRPPPQGGDGRQVPGSAERLHHTQPRPVQGGGAPPRRPAAHGRHVARPPRALHRRSPGAVWGVL
mmetsp:Transcript_15961/g.37844  ORF Transcript_15961/g.37844 Transcript_15961/m.37844 type:complete len:276 (+) Transcript_15961:3838-4665(+)